MGRENHSSDDMGETQTEINFDDATKYKLLSFLNGYRFSTKHLDAIEQVVEICLGKEIEAYRQKIGERIGALEAKFTEKLDELKEKISEEAHARDKQDELFKQEFSTLKEDMRKEREAELKEEAAKRNKTNVILAILGLAVAALGLLK